MATEMILGKSVDDAYLISEQAVAVALGGMPEYKMLCSNLAPKGIRRAIDDWRRRFREEGGSQSSRVGR
jgi:nitrogen fixation NifU-like protein